MNEIDPLWIQNTTYELNTSCSSLQRIASAWRDNPRLDPMHVAIAAREMAKALYAVADRIEGKRNACINLEAAAS